MEHNIPLITTIAAGFGFALIFGFIAERFKVPALVGYLAAGILIGPATPGFVADMSIASELAEIGVMLLMFGVGLHFSFKDLLAVKKIAVPGAVVQMSIATVLGMMLAMSWGWTWGASAGVGAFLILCKYGCVVKGIGKTRCLRNNERTDRGGMVSGGRLSNGIDFGDIAAFGWRTGWQFINRGQR